MLSVLLLLAVLQPAARPGADPATNWPGALLHIDDDDGPEIVAYLQPEMELVAVRLSIQMEEYPGAVSGAVAHQQLVRDRLSAAVARLGGRVELERRPTHVVYTLVGPGRELPGMVAALRQALLSPAGTSDELTAAWLRAERVALAEMEIPAARVRHELWRRFEAADDAGDALVAVHGPGALPAFWHRYYRPERMRVIVVGGTDENTILAVFSDWEAPSGSAGALPPLRVEVDPAPQLMAPWVGIAYDGRAIPLATLAVATRLLNNAVTDTGAREAAAELWLQGDGAATVLVASGPPGSTGSAAVRRLADALTGSMDAAAVLASDAAVERARRSLRRDLFYASRTPEGLAELLGDFADRTGDVGTVGRLLSQLDRVEGADVRAALRVLASRHPMVVELTP